MNYSGLLLGAFLVAAVQQALGVAPTAEELAGARKWVAARFEAPAPGKKAEPGLLVLANNDPVIRNNRGGKPLKLAGREFTRGLFCHAVSKVVVRLPGPGKTFSAAVGVDSNEQTSGGRGSVVFGVSVGGKQAFKSGVLREGMPPVPVAVDLGGATEFILEVGDAGDGISCDQSDWADAKVVLADGKEVWLGDLPFIEEQGLLEVGPPFSFTYGGQPSATLLPTWERKQASRKLDDARTEHVVSYTDPRTGLALRCVAIEYHDFPTVEWALYFKNTGKADTPILADIQALDAQVVRSGKQEFLLHHAVGSPCSKGDYGPLLTELKPNATKRIAAAGGRPTNTDWSYFNIEWGTRGEDTPPTQTRGTEAPPTQTRGEDTPPTADSREGLIVVVGWPGQWAATFARNGSTGLRIRAGQELTHFKLLPGEEVRSPLMVLQFWKGGDWIRAQNLWRRWMMAHSMPKPGGKLPPPQFVAASSRAYNEMIDANTENQIMFINRFLEEGLKLDYWWMDAGWYIQEKGWPQVGTWEVDPKRFPKGFKPISDHAHAKGMGIVVWFEPERVADGTWLAENRPEWLLGKPGGNRLLNLGNDEARKWLTEHVDKLITEQGIDLYRQDFNFDPLGYWRANDAPDRQGITEIKHVTGYLAYWDELLRRHPKLLIDSCASGGRRNDLETMRRAVPLWRSDYAFEATGHQGMTYGLSFWLPYHGTGTVACDNAPYYGGGKTPVQPYAFWSNAAPSLGCGIDLRVKDIDYDKLRKLVGQWRAISKHYYGDFYPLTPYSLDNSAWMAWQFDGPEPGEGVVQAFRRPDSPYVAAQFRLRGLDPAAEYTVTNLDEGKPVKLPGRQLLDDGLLIAIPGRPGVAILTYKVAGAGE